MKSFPTNLHPSYLRDSLPDRLELRISQSMKISRKLRWVCVVLVLGLLIIGGVILTDGTASYLELKESCDGTLSKSPSSDTLDAWMKANQIPSERRSGPLDDSFKQILVANGIPKTAATDAASCTYFESLHVRGGFLSTHVAYGYFTFASDGSLIEYKMHDIYYGM